MAWLAVACSKTTVTQLMRVAWRTVGGIVQRVCADVDAVTDRFAGLRRIGIDEISYKKGHKYLTIVVDHDSGRLVWAAPGRDRATLTGFFDALEASGAGRCQALTHVSGDGADWIGHVVGRHAPQAVLCANPFHVVAWATHCLDMVRREVWNQARHRPGGTVRADRRAGLHYNMSRGDAKTIQRSRWALWKNPEDLTDNQRDKCRHRHPPAPGYTAPTYEGGPAVRVQGQGRAGQKALDRGLAWAQRCRIQVFVDSAARSNATWSRSTPPSNTDCPTH